ncbi:MAG: hypothetical protein QXD34_02965 [Candidatus Bathyarchaeia archaeon]|nr:hypothetical protein [Candidatus Bathyarchaeota archaeon]
MKVYAVWIKVDETLPWIELKGTYQSRREARKAAKEFLKTLKVKIVKVNSKRKSMRAVVMVKQ